MNRTLRTSKRAAVNCNKVGRLMKKRNQIMQPLIRLLMKVLLLLLLSQIVRLLFLTFGSLLNSKKSLPGRDSLLEIDRLLFANPS